MSTLSPLIAQACARREALHRDPEQNAYRLFHGYGEGYPGVAVDRYGDVALITHKESLEEDLGELATALGPELRERCPTVIAKSHRHLDWNAEALSVGVLRGELPRAPVPVLDGGLRLLATPHSHTSNGLFLDSRPIRTWLRENSRGRRILNLFAYTGSLGVAAAAGGARSVVHVDKKKGPLSLARENHRANDLSVDARNFMAGDVYQHLPRAARSGASFDGIILDPPPRVHRRKGATGAASQDFAELAKLSCALLAPGGWLLCFFHRFDRSRAEFEAEVLSHSGCPLEVLWRGGSGEDFPEPNPEHALRVTAFIRG